MKKIMITAMAVLIYISISGISSLMDGSWNDPNIWSGGSVPTEDDDVIVGHLVTITGGASCHNLTMQSADSMVRNNYQTESILYIRGNLYSTGWIASNTSQGHHLTVNLFGNLESYYNFSPGRLNVLGSGNRYFALDADSFLSPHLNINIAATIDTIFATGNLNFGNSSTSGTTTVSCLDDNFHICLSDPATRLAHPMTISNCTVQNGVISGTGSNIVTWTNTRNGYANNLRLEQVQLNSPDSFQVTDSVTLSNVVNNATIYNHSSNNRTLSLEGEFTNNGNIRNHPSGYNLNINSNGNIFNNGWFAPYQLAMLGSGERNMGNSPGNPFRVNQNIEVSSGISVIHAISDLHFLETDQINGAHFDLSNELRDGWDIRTEGLELNSGSINGGSGSEFAAINTSAQNVSISGVIISAESTLNFKGGCSMSGCPNYGIIQNNSSYLQNLYVYGAFTNYGTIRNNPSGYHLNIYADNNIVNNGVWMNNSLILNGIVPQTISFPVAHLLKPAYFTYSGSGGSVILALGQDMKAENCILDLNNAALILPSGTYGMIMSGCQLYDANVQCAISNFLNMDGGDVNGCSFQSVTNMGILNLHDTSLNGSIINNGTIQNSSNYIHNLYISQNLTNNGLIRNHPSGYSLNVYVAGNIVNNGTWTNNSIYLNGSVAQYLSFPVEHGYNGAYLYRIGSTQPVIPATDLYLTNCIADLGTALLDLSSGGNRNVHLSNSILKRANVLSTTASVFNMQSGGFIENVSFQSITLAGTISINTDTTISGILINNGILQNYPSYYMNIYLSEVFNNGTIRDNPSGYNLYQRISGNIHNPGVVNCYRMYLTGNYCHLDNPGTINTRYLTGTANPSELALGNNMGFINTEIDFTSGTRGTIRMNDLRTPIVLTMDGGVINNANIIGGTGAIINGVNPCIMRNCGADELTTQGTIWVENVTIGLLTNNGTIKNYHSYYQNLYVTNRLDNHGTIINNSSYNLTVNLAGDLYDYGVMNIAALNFTANADQHIYQDAAADTLRIPALNKNTTSGELIMLSSLKCLNTVMNLHGHNLQMFDGRSSFGLSMKGGYITETYLETSGYSELWMANGAFLTNINGGDMIFGGVIIIQNTCSFGNVTNNAAIINSGANNANLYVTGDFNNPGTISNGNAYSLNLFVGGNLNNSGSIGNGALYINGNMAQEIIKAGTFNPTHFYLVSDVGSATWYHDGIASGLNGAQIEININMEANLGLWQAFNVGNNSWGRIINIHSGQAPSTPQGFIITINSNNIILQWNQALYANAYRLYASEQPLGGFVMIVDNIIDANTGDGIVQYTLPATESRRFFRVSSKN